jgi:hypothetical protein
MAPMASSDPHEPERPAKAVAETTDRPRFEGRSEVLRNDETTVVAFHLPEVSLADLRFRVRGTLLHVWSTLKELPYQAFHTFTEPVDPCCFYVTQNNGLVEVVLLRSGLPAPTKA